MKTTVTITEYHHTRATVPFHYWEVSVQTATTIWEEVYGSREQVNAFIKGVQAGASSQGSFDVEIVEKTA